MMINVKNLAKINIVLVIGLLFLFSCKKKEATQVIVEKPSVTFNLKDLNCLPMQFMVIQSNKPISNYIKAAMIGQIKVDLIKINEFEWSFLCPVLSPGNYKIQVDNSFELDFLVNSYSPITNPENQITLFKDEINDVILNVNNTNLSNKIEISNQLNYYKTSLDEVFSQLSNNEKIQLAYFIKSNKYDRQSFSELINSNLPDSFLGKSSAFDPTDATNMFIINFASAKINFLIAASSSTALFLAPEPTMISKGLAVISAVAAITNVAVMNKLIDNDLSKLLGKAVDLEVFQKKGTLLKCSNSIPFNLGLKAPFSTFVQSDKSLGIFPNLFNGIEEVNSQINSFYRGYRMAKSWFISTQPTFNQKLLQVGNVSLQKQYYINSKYISLGNVSNPEIQVSLEKIGSQMLLKASSSIVKTKTQFTISLIYNQSNVNNKIERNIDIEFDPDSVLEVGSSYQGGIIAYFFKEGDPGFVFGELHGLIAAPNDQSLGCYGWTGSSSNLPLNSTLLGSGNLNTLAIINACSDQNIAARICSKLELNNYSDWYLPSLDELKILCQNRVAIGGFPNPIWNYLYWSSSTGYYSGSTKPDMTWVLDFSLTGTAAKTWPGGEGRERVRVIRTF